MAGSSPLSGRAKGRHGAQQQPKECGLSTYMKMVSIQLIPTQLNPKDSPSNQRVWEKGVLFQFYAIWKGLRTGRSPPLSGSDMAPFYLPYDPAIPLLGIHTEEKRSERDTCTPMFIAALFIIARTWKQPRCPSADKWIRKLRYIYTMEYYSAIKKNSFESFLMRWMKLEPIIQREDQYSILTHIYGI